MKKRLYANLMLLSALGIVCATVLVAAILQARYFEIGKEAVRTTTQHLALVMNAGDESLAKQLSAGEESRVTWISADGTVLYDNREDAARLENHKDRPEVLEALKSGEGETVRHSSTLQKRTFYVAKKLTDGSIVRLAYTTDSGFAVVVSCIPYMLLLMAILFLVCALVGRMQTASLVAPINAIDPDHPLSLQVYDELSPLLRKLEQQKRQIGEQMEKLGRRQAEFEAITARMNEGLAVFDKHLDLLSVNDSMLSCFASRRADCMGRSPIYLTREMRVQRLLEDTLVKGRGDLLLEQGGKYWQLMASAMVAKEDSFKTLSESVGVVLLALDVTQRQKAEQMRREFSANVSHELRTPLTAISGFAELIETGLAKQEDVQKFGAKIHNEAGRLMALVEDIMRLSGLDEQHALPKEPVAMTALAAEMVEHLQPAAKKRQIVLQLTAKDAVVPDPKEPGWNDLVLGNRQLLGEVLFNLCDNAIRYNKVGGQVTIDLAPELSNHLACAKQLRITVTDTGIGIPTDQLERIFERFYRVDKSHSKETGGTGLGLSIVKNAVHYHDGKVWAQSSPGTGSKFTVILPLTDEAEA